MDKSSHMTLDGARRAARCHELGADLAPAAARNELLNSVNPLLFESPGDVAVNSPQLRRCVSLYLNPRKSVRRGRIFVSMCLAALNLNCAVHHLFIAYTRNHSIAGFNMYDQELQPVSKNFAAIKSNGATPNGSVDRDRADLMRLGKKPVLRVRLALAVKFLRRLMCSICSVTFGFMSMLGFSCTVLTTWEAILK